MALASQLVAAVDKYMFKGKVVSDIVFADNPILDLLIKKNLIKHSGSRAYKALLEIDYFPAQAYGRTTVINREMKDIITEANFEPKWYNCSYVVPHTDLLQWGDDEIVDQMLIGEQNVIKSLGLQVHDDFYKDGSEDGGIHYAGLDALFDQTTSTAYGGIMPSDFTDTKKWLAYKKTSFGALNSAATLQNFIYEITSQKEDPTILVTSKYLFDNCFAKLAFDQIVLNKDLMAKSSTPRANYIADLGQRFLSVGGIPLMWDKKMDDNNEKGTVYGLNENYLDFVTNPKAWFSPTFPGMEYLGEGSFKGWYKDFDVQLQMATNKRNAHSMVEGITLS